jgi:hypothetical protein
VFGFVKKAVNLDGINGFDCRSEQNQDVERNLATSNSFDISAECAIGIHNNLLLAAQHHQCPVQQNHPSGLNYG